MRNLAADSALLVVAQVPVKICDRCGEPAMDEIILKSEDTHVDVCPGCRELVLQALRPEPEKTPHSLVKEYKRRGRPPKEKVC